ITISASILYYPPPPSSIIIILSPLRLLFVPAAISTISNIRFKSSTTTTATVVAMMMSSSANNMNLNDVLQVKFLSASATLPTRGSPQSAGFDLASAEQTVVPSGGRAVVKTDISIACPEGTYARIAPRSGLAVKHMIDCGAGVVDADYRGNVGVVLFNFGPHDFEINVGDRIAQLILEQISMAPAVQVEELTETSRGEGGFGSTGVSGSIGEKKVETGEKEEKGGDEPMAKMQRVISPNNVDMGVE
ncbi:hypothetical protein ACHAXH_005146, partial [Discostella pseudostelligera]